MDYCRGTVDYLDDEGAHSRENDNNLQNDASIIQDTTEQLRIALRLSEQQQMEDEQRRQMEEETFRQILELSLTEK